MPRHIDDHTTILHHCRAARLIEGGSNGTICISERYTALNARHRWRGIAGDGNCVGIARQGVDVTKSIALVTGDITVGIDIITNPVLLVISFIAGVACNIKIGDSVAKNIVSGQGIKFSISFRPSRREKFQVTGVVNTDAWINRFDLMPNSIVLVFCNALFGKPDRFGLAGQIAQRVVTQFGDDSLGVAG